MSDNGPQYACAEFAKSYVFCHTTTSPHYPQANGEAERAVQTATDMTKEARDPYKALLNYRNTPLEEVDLSPAQLMMGRRLKSTLPTTAPLLRPQGAEKVKQILKKRKKNKSSTMTNTVAKSCHHSKPVTLCGCNMETSGYLQEYRTSIQHQGLM